MICTCLVNEDTQDKIHNTDCNYRIMYQEINGEKKETIRVSHPLRYDILIPEFLEDLARIADYGAKKYGDLNWQKSHLEGDKGCINHIYKHLKSFRTNEPYDHSELGTSRRLHLAAIAFNAMMEYYWIVKEEEQK